MTYEELSEKIEEAVKEIREAQTDAQENCAMDDFTDLCLENWLTICTALKTVWRTTGRKP